MNQLAQPGMAQELAAAQVFTLLFLMLGPFKILGPFAQLTKGVDDRQAIITFDQEQRPNQIIDRKPVLGDQPA